MTDVIPYFRDYPNPQPAFTDDVHDMIRKRMERQSQQAGTQPRGWDGPRSPGQRRYHGRRAIDRARVLELHKLGMTVQEIADDMDRSIRGVSRALGEVRVRGKDSATGSQQNAKKARIHREYLRPQVEDMLAKGFLKKQVAARLGVSMDTIRRIIAEGVDGTSGPA